MFIIGILLALNLLLLLNPISKSDDESLSSEMYNRSLFTSQNIMMIISVIFCISVLEIYHYLLASSDQKKVFFKGFHRILILWLVAMWLSYQKVPERLFPTSRFV